jgi:Mg-chelatase subunit ChlD
MKKQKTVAKKVDAGYVHMTMILDRTGSMESIRDDAIGGFNAFIKEQQKVKGRATLSLVQFDSQDPYEVIHDFRDIQTVPELTRDTYVPRASTPLLDAMGRGINDLEKQLAGIKDKPAKVLMVVITDGQENASQEFKREQIVRMIKDKEEKAKWQFVFLSADLGGINEAMDLGVKYSLSIAFDKTSKGTMHAYASLSNNIAEFRSGVADDMEFRPSQRAEQELEKKRKPAGKK